MLTAGVMSCGGIEFKTKGRDDQASQLFFSSKSDQYISLSPILSFLKLFLQAECEEIGPESFAGKACAAFCVDAYNTIKTFCKPRIKVGTEWVTKGQSCGG